ncbi:hypothetical protein CYMTET_7549 [Cymbomonas tetramitiformis]|uniref:H/ACA ribonucleoprotein complex subunit 2 n=1 Tax=Cymbomonas tetramitiformis TaxID=36881 RepID=A0AAE0LGS4_9CHLO|nr:hypothetical protein CYMTET_7549 [Cymbomonas tetramitiformis]|eukprot:gene21830-26272_t
MADEEKKVHVCAIAKPLANETLTKKVLKLVKKASKKKQVKRGVKEVVKAVRKKQKGICVIAGDISPIDVISHVPILCESGDIPYIFVPSKEDLGAASNTKRPTSCMLVLPKPVKASDEEDKEFTEEYKKMFEKVQSQQLVF